MELSATAVKGLLSLPSICKGENFAGFLTKNQTNSLVPISRQFDDKVSWVLPYMLEKQVPLLGSAVGSVNDVLTDNTLLPALSRFLAPADAARLRAYHLVGARPPHRHPFAAFRNSFPGSNWKPGICLACLDEDISPDGNPFWRRDFVLFDFRLCARHGTRIHDICDTCANSGRWLLRLTWPKSRCLCGGKLKPRVHPDMQGYEHVELDFVRGWSRLLDAGFAPHMQGPQIAAVINRQAQSIGIVDGMRVRWNDFYEFFLSPGCMQVAQNIGFTFKSESVRGALAGEAPPRNPFHSLFMLIALFDGWDNAELALLSPAPPSPSTHTRVKHGQSRELGTAARKRLHKISMTLLPETIALYNSLRKKHPSLSHSNIRDLLPPTNQLAVTRARLLEHGANVPPARHGTDIYRKNDALLVQRIKERARTFKAMNTTRRLTAHLLMGGHRGSACPRHVFVDRYPNAAAALEKLIETPLQRYIRLLRPLVLSGQIPGWRAKDVGRLKDLQFKQAQLLWNRHMLAEKKRGRS
ncbi:hypothetical protein [Burkholderia sp. Bp9140]|uniref:hypothetical protein n=1 Tax=Burkholderia sp. Bp9140 TaxID=2184572 RepID=UPI000F583660|nr:hypothetical protein [Burkholderia sp. Bp9140]